MGAGVLVAFLGYPVRLLVTRMDVMDPDNPNHMLVDFLVFLNKEGWFASGQPNYDRVIDRYWETFQ